MNFKQNHYYSLKPDELLNKILTALPVNSFINKGRCGNGGTYIELYNYSRNSIIVVPNVAITKDKAYPDNKPPEQRLFAVHGEATREAVKDFMEKGYSAQKIITTPSGLNKILWAASELKISDRLYKEWFIMIDEAHSAVTETYRDDVMEIFEHFWDFENKCIISATPYYFSDPKIYELTHHKVIIEGSIGTVNLIGASNVSATLKEMIVNLKDKGSKLFIFYNSVTEIAKLLKAMKLEDCRIYCSEDKDGENFKKLGEYQKYWRKQPRNSEFTGVNFFTTTAFEGWDMNIEESIMITATDINKPHTLVGVDKCVQAVGRARKKVKHCIHITNHRNIQSFKSLDTIKEYYTKEANKLYSRYLEHMNEAKEQGFKPEYDIRIERYCDDAKTHPKINTYKLDRVINEEFNREIYNHISFIAKAWEQFYYKVKIHKSNAKWESKRDEERISKADILRRDYLKITEEPLFFLGISQKDTIQRTNPLAYRASLHLNQKEMEELKYSNKKVEAELIKRENDKKKIQLIKLIDLNFKAGNRYTKAHITEVIQHLYDSIEMMNKKGEPAKAKATDIKLFFEPTPCKINEKGKYVNGFILNRPTFHLKMVG